MDCSISTYAIYNIFSFIPGWNARVGLLEITELYAQSVLEGLEPLTREQVFELSNMLEFQDGSRKEIAEGFLFAWWVSAWWRLWHV